jgi:hypothetical protein
VPTYLPWSLRGARRAGLSAAVSTSPCGDSVTFRNGGQIRASPGAARKNPLAAGHFVVFFYKPHPGLPVQEVPVRRIAIARAWSVTTCTYRHDTLEGMER